MKNISTGAGLVVLGLGIALHPIVSGLVAQATAAPSSSSASAAAAVASAATAQAGPTVVWYGVAATGYSWSTGAASSVVNNAVERFVVVARAWSDGRVEAKTLYAGPCGIAECDPGAGWQTVSAPTQGFKAAADINADELVDGADLASVLSNWGDAPRMPFPPSDCPLNLVNP